MLRCSIYIQQCVVQNGTVLFSGCVFNNEYLVLCLWAFICRRTFLVASNNASASVIIASVFLSTKLVQSEFTSILVVT